MNDMGPRQLTIISIILLFGAMIPIIEFHTSSGNLINPSAIQNHSNITIDGNGQFTSANGVVSGGGTKNNPYIIENWSIDATNDHGIDIIGTNYFFIIRKCYIYNGTNSSGNNRGIRLFNVTNGKIINNRLVKNYDGIYIRNSNNITIANNTCNFNYQNGIDFHKEFITIINNTCNSNGFCGIQSYQANNNLILNNNCSHNNKGIESGINSYSNIIENNSLISNDNGIDLFQSTNITIKNNSLYSCSIFLILGSLQHWNTHTIDSTNLVNNKPVCFLKDVNNTTVPQNVGQIILANCSGITIENQTINNITCSIILGFSDNITINNCSCSFNNHSGILLYTSNNNYIKNGKFMSNNYSGVIISFKSDYNVVENNTCVNNGADSLSGGIMLYLLSEFNVIRNNSINFSINGICVAQSSNNIILNNSLSQNQEYGLMSYFLSDFNIINNNTMNSNANGISLGASSNCTISDNSIISNQKKGIMIYLDSDFNKIFNNTIKENNDDGIDINDSNNNEIYQNTIRNNNNGTYINNESFINIIFNNNYIQNLNHAIDLGINTWNLSKPTGGNYFDNWTKPDNNADGFVDYPFKIAGGNAWDLLPLTKPFGDISPTVHNYARNKNYTTIQAAIDDADANNWVKDTINVDAGVYNENVVINISLNIIGENMNNTTINGGHKGDVVRITADSVNFSGFKVINSANSLGYAGLELDHSIYSNILDCNCSDNYYGIFLSYSSSNRINNCYTEQNEIGIRGDYSPYCLINHCKVTNNNNNGIWLESSKNVNMSHNYVSESNWIGIYTKDSDGLFIFNNTIISNTKSGVYLSYSKDHTVINNTITQNSYGGLILLSASATVINNDIINNTWDGLYADSSDNLYIFKNNITSNSRHGIYLVSSDNCNVQLNDIISNGLGLRIYHSTKNDIITNNISRNNQTMHIYNSNSIKIINNTFYSNFMTGLDIESANSIYFINNTISKNAYGINMIDSSSVKFYNNNFTNNGITIQGNNLNHWDSHEIPLNNSINGKPIYYWLNKNNMIIPSDAGEFILANCKNIEFKDINISDTDVCIELGFSYGIKITKSNFNNCNLYGIYLSNSSTINLTQLHISNCRADGLHLYKSHNNSMLSSTINSTKNAVYLEFYSQSNLLRNNELINNWNGIILRSFCSNNLVRNNNIFNNSRNGIYVYYLESQVDAKYNWWGDSTGPYHSNTNPSGKGDDVSDHVTYKPWLLGEIGNLAPKIETQDITTTQEDTHYTRTYFANDPEGDKIEWSLNTNASWLAWGILNNTLYGTPTNADVGTFWVEINITDGKGKFDEHYFILTVTNTAPSIIFVNKKVAYEDSLYQNDYNSSDDGQGFITWNLHTNASWLNIDKYNGVLSGTPSNSDVGSFWVEVTVNDGNGGEDTVNFTLFVMNTNDQPIIDTVDVTTIYEDKLYSVTYSALDIDINDQLTWTFESNAKWLNWGIENSTLFGIPRNSDLGKWWVYVNVTDLAGDFDSHYFKITVLNINDPPVIETEDILVALENQRYEVRYIAFDMDPGDSLTWKFESNASWLAWDRYKHILHGTPDNSHVGEYRVSINVTDSYGAFDEHFFYLIVVNVNDPPSITNAPKNLIVNALTDHVLDLSKYIFDMDNKSTDLKLHSSSNYSKISGLSIIFNYPYYIDSEYVKIVVTDGLNSSKPHYITIQVVTTNVPFPRIIDHSPVGSNVSITSNITITFNESMDYESVETAFSTNPFIPGEFMWEENKLIYKLTKNMSYMTKYAITINTTASSLLELPLKNIFSWDFTTEKEEIKELDTDGDNIPDKLDDDDDNDNIPDSKERIIGTDSYLWDTDGDGYSDSEDDYPLDSSKWQKDEKPEDQNFTIILGIVLIVIIIIIIILFLILKRKKKQIVQDKDNSIDQEKSLINKVDLSEDWGANQDKGQYQSTSAQKIEQNFCPTCGLSLKYYPQKNKYYCHQCKKYN